MYTLTLHYSVSNGGDGSAYPQFSLSQDLVEIHQNIQSEFYEGWGESCTGSITLESEAPITVSHQDLKYFITKESLLESLKYYLDGGYKKSDKVKETAEDFVKQINEIQE